MLVIAGVIHFSFRPIIDLAKELDTEQIGRFHHIPVDAAPKELEPFISSINRLLDRLGVMLDHQRRFVALAAHELRTPIAAIGIQSENIDNSRLSEDAKARLIALKAGIRRTGRLLEQLLALSKYDYGRSETLSPVTMDGIVRSVVAELMAAACARSIDLGCSRLEAALVDGDGMALKIMVRNLVDNAVRYSPTGGQVNFSVYRDDDRVVLLIEDTGPGIAASDFDIIFEPFNRGSLPRGDGSGLGLSIARRIVDNHGGIDTSRKYQFLERDDRPSGGGPFASRLRAVADIVRPDEILGMRGTRRLAQWSLLGRSYEAHNNDHWRS
jgi:two-component system, OmpR family, sensor kinase